MTPNEPPAARKDVRSSGTKAGYWRETLNSAHCLSQLLSVGIKPGPVASFVSSGDTRYGLAAGSRPGRLVRIQLPRPLKAIRRALADFARYG